MKGSYPSLRAKKFTAVYLLVVFLFAGRISGSFVHGAVFSQKGGAERENLSPQAMLASPGSAYLPYVSKEISYYSTLRFAVIGDYGSGSIEEADVAAMVNSWNPDFILTTGDNNYPEGSAGTIDKNIGQFFHEYIYPYLGGYGEGGLENRFFPSLGNHDWPTTGPIPYQDYFTLPGNERYYEFRKGPLHFFVLNSVLEEPDGADIDSIQADWLKSRITESESVWKIVYMHHPPFSSGLHGSTPRMQWPFADWGVDAVLSGHDHTYERISREGIFYFVNGLGGRSRYEFGEIVEGSQLRYNENFGAMLVSASRFQIRFEFINREGNLIDSLELVKPVLYEYVPNQSATPN